LSNAQNIPQQSEGQPDTLPKPKTQLGFGEDVPSLAVEKTAQDSSDEVVLSFWDDLRDSIPPWITELTAIGVGLFAILSFLALLDTTTSSSAITWRNLLTSLFGQGSIGVAVLMFCLAVMIGLQKAFPALKLASAKVLAVEVGFLCALALLHALPNDPELRALARAGQGGGMIGWGLTALPYWLAGSSFTVALFAFVLALCGAVLIGVKRSHVIYTLTRVGDALLDYADALVPPKPSVQVVLPDATVTPSAPPPATAKRNPIMRIKPNYDNLPPSMRPSANAPRKEALEELKSHPLFATGHELKVDFNVIGELTNRKTDDGFRIVRRPDGREKRYFAIVEMKEAKKLNKRDKALPSIETFQEVEMVMPDEKEINHNVVLIENTLLEFDIEIDVVDVQVGPTVTRYAVQPYQTRKDGSTERTRLSKIASYSSDLALALSAKRLRLEIPVPGTNYMGIEVPNRRPSMVTLRSVYESKAFAELQLKNTSPLLIPLGRDVSGAPLSIDLAKQPHLLIAGTTGSGKSVCIAAIATALVLNNMPNTVKLIMLDPKMVELSRFNGLPHLLGNVETETERIIGVLKWCTREMDRRYKLLEEHAVRNIDNYNAKFGARRRGRDYLPYIVIMVDEIGDLMLSRPEETETSITRLAQMARAVGMHLIVATQRPSVDVITGLIKANFPGRIAFSVASGVDSRVILDTSGAETLLGRGDMLYLSPEAAAPQRVQGCYVTDEEVRAVVKHWSDWLAAEIAAGREDAVRPSPWERGLTRREFLSETDPMLEDAIEFVVETQEASASIIQRRLGLGYPRAARIMDMLEQLGVVGESVGGGRARKVLISRGEDPFKRIIEERMKGGEVKPLKPRKTMQEYYDEADLDGDDNAQYFMDDDEDDDLK
jgi:S-DNA-T family DNA segregation ATPase FtsK/SpoIIIE